MVVAVSPNSSALSSYPLFVKPIAEGSSKGIQALSKVNDPRELEKAVSFLSTRYPGQDILIEKFLPGREFTVGLMGTGADAEVIGAIELRRRRLRGNDISSQHATSKSATGEIDFLTDDVKCKPEWSKNVETLRVDEADTEGQLACQEALKAWRLLGCRDAGRIDLRSDHGEQGNIPCILEVSFFHDCDVCLDSMKIVAERMSLVLGESVGRNR